MRIRHFEFDVAFCTSYPSTFYLMLYRYQRQVPSSLCAIPIIAGHIRPATTICGVDSEAHEVAKWTVKIIRERMEESQDWAAADLHCTMLDHHDFLTARRAFLRRVTGGGDELRPMLD